MDQKKADRTVLEVYERGINYFDVAPSYWDGEAERKLGVSLKPIRNNVFLACKTMARDASGARAELEESLRRLHTDHFDLYQFHAVTELEDVEKIFSAGGAAETFLKARQEGKIRHIGFSAHSVTAALAMLDRFQFDSVLFPINFVCYGQGNFGPQVVARAKEKGTARLALKAMAYTPWPEGMERKYGKCWYLPIEDSGLLRKALYFTLSEDVTAAIPPGEEKFFRLAMELAAEFTPLKESERAELLAETKDLTPLFKT
jgi:diketogulonate reductase-like aldo/keto reductase